MISHSDLLSLLHYNPKTGIFTWLVNRGRLAKKGQQAGSYVDGYVLINIKGTKYGAHRLAWFYMQGVWPKHTIDHKNLVRDDNRIDNLREASRGDNKANCRKYKNNSTGYKGSYKEGSSYRSFIRVDGVLISLGYFKTAKAAHDAYYAAAKVYRGEFARTE